MTQRLRALADMRTHHTLQQLVRRGVISSGDVIVDDPSNPAHNADMFHGDWEWNGSGSGSSSAFGGEGPGVAGGLAGEGGGLDDDAVEEVQRFLLKEEQERALEESLAADRAKVALRASEERRRREEEEAAEKAAEAAEAKAVWAQMHREHLRESFEEEAAAAAANSKEKTSSLLRLSLVYPATGRRQTCTLAATATMQRLAEFACVRVRALHRAAVAPCRRLV
jgi:hypothetical protein